MATPFVHEEYQLSCEILGHSGDVRSVRTFLLKGWSREHILTASRDGTACVWAPEGGSNEYILKKVMKQHTGYVSALCVIPPDEFVGRDMPVIVTGGQDKTILLHSLEEGVEEPLERYVGHTELVTCIIYQHDQLISSSWDSTIRVWKGPKQCEVMEAHKPAVWTIVGLFEFDGTRRLLSGGADRSIRLWEVDTRLCLQEYRGHSDVVRDIKLASSEVFFSAANDCTIRKWNIHSGQCLREIYGHEAYVYCMSLFPHGSEEDFTSCGEDSSLRIWKTGECQQVVHLPATSVWSVWNMENGDVVTGSSDGVARVFTAATERKASPAYMAVFEKKVAEHRSSGSKSDIDVKSLPGTEALAKPGRKSGDTLMINNGGIAEVYQWSEETAQWDKIGDAVGQAPQSSNVYHGKEYDYVFDIELDEGSPTMRKLKLPYNKTTDPYIAAEEFLEANNLPVMYLDQVAEFIVKNAGEYAGPIAPTVVDPFTGGSRYVPDSRGRHGMGGSDPFTGGSRYHPGGGSGGNVGSYSKGGGADPFTGGSSYRPNEFSTTQPQVSVTFKGLKNSYFPVSGFKTFTSPEDYGDKVMGKIREFNAAQTHVHRLTEEQLTRLHAISQSLTSAGHSSTVIEDKDLQLIQAVLRWPPENIFPGLDLLRLALLNDCGSRYLIGDADDGKVFIGDLFAFAVGSQAQAKNQLLVLRSLANIFCKEIGAQLMHYERRWVLSQMESLLLTTNRSNQIALTTIVLNYCHHYSNTKDEEGMADCVQYAVKILQSSFDNEAKFRVMLGIGSLALVNKAKVLSSAQPDDLPSLIQPLSNVLDPPKVSQCAEFVLQALGE